MKTNENVKNRKRQLRWTKPIALAILALGITTIWSCSDDDATTDTTPPGEVSNFTIELGDSQVILSWVAPNDSDVSGYSLTYTPNGPVSPIVLTKNTTTTAITDLMNGTEYTFTIRVLDTAGNESSGVSVTATPQEPVGTLLSEDFEAACSDGTGAPAGWLVYSGDENISWGCDGRLGSFAMQANNFDFTGSLPPAEDWLISPAVELPEEGDYQLTFQYSSNGDEIAGFGLTARISTDYSGIGDPSTATWTELDAGIEEINTGVNALNLAGEADLSAISGTAYIAFFYTSSGSAAGQVRRIFLDNVKIARAGSEDTFAPANVSSLIAEAGDQSVVLNWTEPIDEDLAGYTLTYSPGGSPITIGAGTTTFTIEGLNNGTEYTFTLVSLDESGNESSGVSVNATPVSPPMAIFEENFNSSCSASGEAPEGWTIFSSSSDRDWSCSERNGPYSMEVNGFGGNEASQDWLISPSIDLEEGTDFVLTFDYSARFSDEEGFGLEARISTDYSGTGDPATATWTTLEAGIAPTEGDSPVPSAAVSLAEYEGPVYIAFYYTSSSGNSARRVTLDNVQVANFIFSENFDTACSTVGESPTQWTVFSSASNRDWTCSDRNGQFSMEVNGFGGDTGSQDWLISPIINLAPGNASVLAFEYSQRFSDLEGFGLEVRISSNYDGTSDPATATWTSLDAGIAPTESDSPVASDEISLSSYQGDVHIAFYYTTSAGDSAYRVTVDNIRVF